MENTIQAILVVCERIEGQWGVVFYPFIGCNIEQAMLLSKHKELSFAQRYREQFLATLRDYHSIQ